MNVLDVLCNYHNFHKNKELPDDETHILERVVLHHAPHIFYKTVVVLKNMAYEQGTVGCNQMILHVLASFVDS